jgi:hypothetical protein
MDSLGTGYDLADFETVLEDVRARAFGGISEDGS